MSVQSNNKRIAKNTIYLYMRMIVVLFINLYTTRVLLRSLGVEDYGIYNVVGGVVTFMAFVQSTLSNGFQRFFNIYMGRGNDDDFVKLFSTSITVQLIISAIFILATETVGLWFLNNQMTIPENRIFAANTVYQSSIFVFLLTMFSSPYNAVTISYEKMNFFAITSIINVLLKLFIAFIVVFWGYDRLILYSLLAVLVQFILFISYFIYAKKLNPKLSSIPIFDKPLVLEMMSFSGWNLFGAIAHAAKGQGLNIVLNLFFDPLVNAARGVAFQVSAGISQCYSSFQTAARPQVMKYYAQNNISEMIKLSNRISRFSFLLLWMIDLPLLFTADYYIRIWLGSEMPELAPAFTNIVLITVSIECFSNPTSNLVHATGKMKVFQIVASSTIMFIIPLAYCVLKLGAPPVAALYCSLFMAPITQIVRLVLVKRLLPFSIRLYLKSVILPCAFVVLSSVFFMYMFTNYLFVSINPIILSIVCFLCAIVTDLLVGCTKGERDAFFSKIKVIVKK